MPARHRILGVAAIATLAAAPLFAQPAPAPAAAAAAAPAAPSAATTPAAKPAAAPAAGAERGKLAWYGSRFAGRKTASGEVYDPSAMTMAHKSLPFGTRVKVTNLANGRSIVLRVNDRGPGQLDRVGDVSAAAARKLGMQRAGVVDAELQVVAEAPAKKR